MRRIASALTGLLVPVLAACGGSGGGSPGPGPGGPVPTGNALSFDGIDDLAQFTFPLVATTNFSFEAWIKPTTLDPAAPNLVGIIDLPSAHNLILRNDQTSFAYAVSVPGTNSAISPTATVQAGVWQHVAGTYDGTNIRIYHDGTLVGTLAHPGTAGGAAQLFLGAFNGAGFFHGLIDEVRIWSVTRSGTQIQAAMNSVLPASEPGLLAYWRFEETPGQVVSDLTSNDFDGTLGTDAAVAADDPTFVAPGAPVS